MGKRAPSDPRIRFGLRLREVRRSRGLSQEQLAHETGLDRTYVSSCERAGGIPAS
ncbi:MAG: helix-turn-helix transcriptional regulator [Armatimonadota bacterium]|nr:helix-turn-helix transcriptional regulator [Armatimonadota bacterium]